MKKKIILGLGAVAIVIAGVASFSAFEAHVINVTAKIENALAVSTNSLEFGTVFPQEYLEKDFTIYLSDSFMAEGNADDVNYVINQKIKCWNVESDVSRPAEIKYAAVNYWANAEGEHECPDGFYPMISLCPYLSKMPVPEEGEYNDTGVPSYFINNDDGCREITNHQAVGKLAKSQNDFSDKWIVDLKVPPFAGYVGQDWPYGCPVLEGEGVDPTGTDMGCDLWIEVTGISRAPEPETGNTVLSLENKDDKYWFIEVDDTYGVLEFNPSGSAMNWKLSVNGLQASTEYKLVYAPDPWPQGLPEGLSTLIGTFTTDGDGNWMGSGITDLGYDLPHPSDLNYGFGAKIWVVLGAHHDGSKMTAWDHTKYLFEYNRVTFDDTEF